MMKALWVLASLAMSTLGAMAIVPATSTEAAAVTCVRGVYRAGCAGPRGAVVARRPPVRAVRVRRY